MDDPRKGQPVTPFMVVYNANIQYDGTLDKLQLIIVVGWNFQNMEMIGNT